MMPRISTFLKRSLYTLLFVFGLLTVRQSLAQTLPLSFNFQSATLPAGLSSNGNISTSGGIGSCTACSPGRLEVPASGFFQMDVPAASVVNLNMKSSGASARTVTVKYKAAADPDYTTAGTISVPQAGNTFELVTQFPAIATTSAVSIRLENGTGGMFHIHDVFIDGSAALSTEAEITAFVLSADQVGNAAINTAAGTINVVVPSTATLTNLVPQTLTISANATISPLASAPQDFSSPVTYTVTAQDGATVKTWMVTVTVLTPPSSFDDYQAEEADFSGTIDNNHTGYTGPGFVDFLADGDNYIVFNVCQTSAGAQTAKFIYALDAADDRTGKLFVNDVYIQDIAFPATGAWTTWAEASAIVALQAGMNTIRITWDTSDGPNLDKLALSGTKCAEYTLTVTTTNSGTVSLSPQRSGNKYFDVETVTLLANEPPGWVFNNWSGDLSGTTNPAQVAMTANKTVTAHFTVVPTFTLQVNTTGLGQVVLSPAGGVYATGTTVTLTANPVPGASFQGWSGDASGSNVTTTVLVDANKTVTAAFSNTTALNFEVPIGFASVNTGSTYPAFNGPVTGGQNAADTFWVNGAADFDALAWRLYYRNRAYKNGVPENGVPKAPLVIVFKPGVYPEGSSSSSAWGNHMMTIQEQGDLTIIGQGGVTLHFGFNIKRSWNILIRNITFRDYYDDGINIGEPETHHIWIDHCTIGHPTTMPSDSEHPDGGIDTKGGASYVTISWCLFRNSWKTSLIGHSDGNGSEDNGKLKVTYFANHFLNTNSRNPRVRFGEVHVLNNLLERIGLYGTVSAKDARVVVEGNFYLNTRWPMYADRALADFRAVYGNNTDNVFTSKTGNTPCVYLKQFNNDYDDSGLPVITAQINPAMLNPGNRSVKFDEHNAAAAFDPHSYYTYTAFDPATVRTVVPLYAGADKIDFFNSGAVMGTVNVVASLSNFNQPAGSPSAAQTYTVTATGLTADLTITPPANYEISVDGGTTWHDSASPLVLPHTGGAIAATIIAVRLNAPAAGNYNGDITHSSTGVTAVNIAVSGSVFETGTPVVIQQWSLTSDANDDAGARAAGVAPGTITLNRLSLSAAATGYTAFSAANGMAFSPAASGDGGGWGSSAGGPGSSLSRVHYVQFIVTADAGYDLRIDSILLSNGFVSTTSGTKIGVDYSFSGFVSDSNNAITTPGSFASPIAITSQNVLLDQKLAVNGPAGIVLLSGQTATFRVYLSCSSTGTSRWALLKDVKVIGEAMPVTAPSPVVLQHWPLTGNATDDATVRSAGVAASTAALNRLAVSTAATGYTAFSAANGMAFSPAASGDGGGWGSSAGGPGSNLSRVHYVQFTVTAAAGYDVKIDSLLLSNGFVLTTSGTKIGVDYSFSGFTADSNHVITTPGSFASPIVITSQNILLDQKLEINGASGITILQGQTVTFRVYFSCSSSGTGRWALLKDVKVIGSASVASGPAAAISAVGSPVPFTQVVGSPSPAQTYSVSGTSLTGDITITPPANYEISADGGTTWYNNASPLVLTPVSGDVAATVISVRLNASATGAHSGDITHSSPGTGTVNIAVTGNTVPPPALATSGTLTAFSHVVGTPSAVQTYSLSGTDLAGNITITPPVHFEVSSDGGATWRTNASPLVITPGSGTASATISVRMNASAAGTHSGAIMHVTTGATAVNVAVSGTAIPAPAITVTQSLNAFSQIIGTASAVQTYTVSGANLTGNIAITAPADYQLSGDGGATWVSSLTLTQAGGSVANTTVSVRLNAATVGAHVGNITHTSSGAVTINVALNGNTAAKPVITVAQAFADFKQTLGTPSDVQTYSVSGTNLTGNITITPPARYELSVNNGAWVRTTVTLSRSGNAVPPTTIRVRLNSAFVGYYGGDIVHASANADTVRTTANGSATFSEEFVVYPLPAVKKVFITHPVTTTAATFTIFGPGGQQVAAYTIQPGTLQTAINIEKMGSGLYYVQYHSGGRKVLLKFLKN